MKTLDAFYLRKPWYIILEDAKYSDEIPKTFINLADAIDNKPFDESQLCEAEKSFNEEYGLFYTDSFFFKEGSMVGAGKVLEEFWAKDLKEKNDKRLKKDKIYLHETFGKGDIYNISGEKFNSELDAFIRSYSNRKRWSELILNKVEKKKKLEVKINLGLAICEIAIFIQNKKIKKKKDDNLNYSSLNDELNIIVRIKNLFEDAFKSSTDNTEVFKRHEDFWKSSIDSIPERFQDSHWMEYLRVSDTSSKVEKSENSNWGILLSYLYIGESTKNHYTPITIKTIVDQKVYNYSGVATFDTYSNSIIAQLIRSFEKETSNSTPTFVFFPVSDEDHQELSIGFTTYFSKNFKRNTAKRAIWQNINKGFDPEFISANSQKFTTLNTNIIRFLHSPLENRLMLPADPISFLQIEKGFRSLAYLIENNTSRLDNDYILKNCIGEYFVCFFTGSSKELNNSILLSDLDKSNSFKNKSIEYLAKNIHIDDLEVYFDSYGVEYCAKYTHSPMDELNIEPEKYIGYIRKQEQTLQIILEEKDLKAHDYQDALAQKDLSSRFIFLSFGLPQISKGSAKKILNEFPFFCGIITGTNKFKEPVSYLAVVVRKTESNNQNEETVKDLRERMKCQDYDVLCTQILKYFHDNSTQLKIIVPSYLQNLTDKYPNLTHFEDRGGKVIKEKHKKGNEDYIEVITLENQDNNQLINETFTGLTRDEVFKKADLWLSYYYNTMKD